MSQNKPILVTAALPYANGPLHLGHIAGAYLPADLYVRYNKALKRDVVFICGSDEHGVPITIAAEKEGVSPQDIVDRYHSINKAAFQKLGIDFDFYGRTSSRVHHQTSQEFFTKLNEKGLFKKKVQKQLFDESVNMFLPDRYVYGTCPNCSYDHAYGDQCEKCGSSLSPTDLISPKSALSNTEPVIKETEHWFLPLGEMQPKLEEWINSRENWKPNVLGQVKSWLNDGLNDRAVTRDLNWGVPVPLDEAEGKVLYVWFDAPIGYISATKEWAMEQEDPAKWEYYWKNKDSKLVHFIGKDNIVFHCIIFPSMLMENDGFVLPEQVPANEFLNLEGQKLSTSRGWAVWVHEFLEAFDADLMRYALGITMPENKDVDFSWKDFQTRVNTELADILGNFLFRSVTFAHKYFEGKVPAFENLSEVDHKALAVINLQLDKIKSAYERYSFKEAIQESVNLARIGNKYLTETEPWKSRKTDPQKCANSVYVSLQFSAALSFVFEPILPHKMAQLRVSLHLDEQVDWTEPLDSLLKVGNPLGKAEILFAKIEDEQIQQQLNKLQASTQQTSPSTEENDQPYEELQDDIEFDDFLKPDLRVASIVSAERMKKSNKLLKLGVDLGFEQRTILSGIAKFYKPEELIGKKVCVVANLKARKMMGVESQGMILMAENRDGRLHLISTEGENGAKIS